MPPKKKQKKLKEVGDTDAEETKSTPEESFQLKKRRLYEGARSSIKGLVATCTQQLHVPA